MKHTLNSFVSEITHHLEALGVPQQWQPSRQEIKGLYVACLSVPEAVHAFCIGTQKGYDERPAMQKGVA